MNIVTKSVLLSSLSLGAVAFMAPVIANAEIIITGNGTESTNSVNVGADVKVTTGSNCIPTDVKGDFHYSGNHMSGNPVTGLFDNIATNENCTDDIYVHIFGSNQEPETDGWLESQVHVATQTFTIPQGQIGHQVSVTIPQSNYCWFQVDATRTSEVKIPPKYSGDDMISYVFVKNAACDVTPTPTATPSATPTVAPTATPTPSNNGGGSSTESPKTVESIQKSIEKTTMAPTGFVGNALMGLMVTTGAVLTSLGALSLRKQQTV